MSSSHEPGVCVILALDTLAEPREGPASDGLPFPPPEMVRLAAGISTRHRFYQRFIQRRARGSPIGSATSSRATI